MWKYREIKELIGKKIIGYKIKTIEIMCDRGPDYTSFIEFQLENNEVIRLGKIHECCESFGVDFIHTSERDLKNFEFKTFLECSYESEFASSNDEFCYTFYKGITTEGEYVDICFKGESNGYYSIKAQVFYNDEMVFY